MRHVTHIEWELTVVDAHATPGGFFRKQSVANRKPDVVPRTSTTKNFDGESIPVDAIDGQRTGELFDALQPLADVPRFH